MGCKSSLQPQSHAAFQRDGLAAHELEVGARKLHHHTADLGLHVAVVAHGRHFDVGLEGLRVSLLELLMIPVEEDETAAYTVRSLPEDFDIPTHKLFEGGESSGPTPLSACRPRILDQPIIPEKIMVHLGRPSANVQNVTVSFRDYIKNVASSEVYPT